MQTVHTIGRLGRMGDFVDSTGDGTDPTVDDSTTYDASGDPTADGTTYDASADGTTYDTTSADTTAAPAGISRRLVIGATIGAFVLGLAISLANER